MSEKQKLIASVGLVVVASVGWVEASLQPTISQLILNGGGGFNVPARSCVSLYPPYAH